VCPKPTPSVCDLHVKDFAACEAPDEARRPPRIIWMDESVFTEEAERSEAVSAHGLFGGLVGSDQVN